MTTDTRRIVLVHAHPDDETIGNGATMARYAAEGAQVTLVTCTRGEQGEVIPPDLAHLASPDRLGDHRVGELASAMTALGVRDHRFLGDPAVPGRPAGQVDGAVYADSGMAYDHDGGVVPSPSPPAGAFAPADPEEPAERLAALLRELRPQVVVGYEPGGGYGHPDHVQAHLVTMRAVELAALAGPDDEDGENGWGVPKVYWSVMPETLTRAALRALRENQGDEYAGLDPDGRLPSMVVPDDQVTACVDATAYTAAKVAALRAHATQVLVSPNGAWFALSNRIAQPVMGLEFYRLVRGVPGGELDELGRETDLFGGTILPSP